MRNPCRIDTLRSVLLLLLLFGIANAAAMYTAGTAQAAAAGHAGRVATNGDRLTMRSSPNPHSTALGTLANGAKVTIVCQMNGTTMAGTFGTGPLWNKLTTGGLVPDVHVDTGSDGRVAPDCPAGSNRALPAALSFSDRGLRLLKAFEGLVRRPYNDATGNCTIGYGHKIRDGRCTAADRQKYGTISDADATSLLRNDVNRFVKGIRQQLPNTPLAQYEFDAMVSFSFNIGLGGFHRSKVKEDLVKHAPDYPAVPRHLMNWTGHGICGLESRRTNEGTLFRTGTYTTINHCA